MSTRNVKKSLFHVWKIVSIHYLWFCISVFCAFWWLGWQVAIVVGLIELFFNISWWVKLKAKIMKGLPGEFRCLPTHLEEFSELDLNALFKYTEQLEGLGFIKVVDYKLETANGLSRLFSHSQHSCFADVFQIIPVGKEPTPVFCTIHSALEDGWTLSTTIVQPDGIKTMWRNPKSLWTYHPNATSAELLQIHLERRQQIVDDLQVHPLTDLSWEFYFIQQQKGTVQRRETLQRKNIVIALIEATLFEMNPQSEWMGDYPKLAARNRGIS